MNTTSNNDRDNSLITPENSASILTPCGVRKQFLIGCVSLLLLGLVPRPAGAAVTSFLGNQTLAAFNAAALSPPPVCVDFDNIQPGANITGGILNGIQFDNDVDPPSYRAPLIVVVGQSTVTPQSGLVCTQPNTGQHKLFPTSGNRCLSPGGPFLLPGPNPTVENDDLRITFPGYPGQAVSAVGFDILFQSLDGASYIQIQVFDGSGSLLADHFFPQIPGVAGDPGGAFFVGFVSTTGNSEIATVIVNEFDDNNCNPDSNIGYDTFRCLP